MKLEFTQEEVNIIFGALVKQPFETVYQLVNSLQQQVQAELNPAPTETTPAPAAKAEV